MDGLSAHRSGSAQPGAGLVIDVARLPAGVSASRFDGSAHGATVSFFISRNQPGTGTGRHRHPYDETFIVEEGHVRFTVGEETFDVTGGQVVVVPAGAAHSFVNCGTRALRQTSIHAAADMVTEWLE